MTARTAAAGISVEGAREVRKALKDVGAGTRDMTATHRRIAARILPMAQGAMRRRTGSMAGSFRVTASAAKAGIGSSVVYAPVQEFGWPRQGITASNALVGTVQGEQESIRAEYEREVADVIARATAANA